MSHEVLITRRQSIFGFFANPGRGGPKKAGASWCWLPGMLRPASAWICKKKLKCFVLWLSGPHGTSNFDHQSLILSDLNYTNMQLQEVLIFPLKHVIVRLTKIIKNLCKACPYINAIYVLALQRSLIISVGLTMTWYIQLHTWFHAKLAQKILNDI